MRIRTDHDRLKRQAAQLWKQGLVLRQKLALADRELNNLRNAWAGDDELHFYVRWQELKEESSVLRQTERRLADHTEHLLYASKIYREAQIDSVNAARELLR